MSVPPPRAPPSPASRFSQRACLCGTETVCTTPSPVPSRERWGDRHVEGLARPPDAGQHDPDHDGFSEGSCSALAKPGGLCLQTCKSIRPPQPQRVLPSVGLAPFCIKRKSGTVLYTEIPQLPQFLTAVITATTASQGEGSKENTAWTEQRTGGSGVKHPLLMLCLSHGAR